MLPVDIVGKVGRALAEIGATGRVEIGGVAYDALTTGTPIPVGELIEVTGWRLVGESSHVLHVRRPGDVAAGESGGRPADAAPARQLTPEERILVLERELHGVVQELKRNRLPERPPPLSFGSVAGLLRAAAVMVLVATPVVEVFYPPWVLYQELRIKGEPFTSARKDDGSTGLSTHVDYKPRQPDQPPPANAYSVMAKLGHYPVGSFRDGNLFNDWMLSSRPSIHYTKSDDKIEPAKIDAKLFVKRDWERVAAECFVAILASAGLFGLAHLHRP